VKKSCDNCYCLIYPSKRGLAPRLVCLEGDEHPDIISEKLKVNGQDCPYWRRQVRIVGDRIRDRRY